MSGIFPNPADGAVAPGVTAPPSFDPTIDPVGTLARYFSQNCNVILRPEVLNAIISQIAAAIDFAGLAYDPAKGHVDLSEAVQYYIQKNLGAYVELAGGPADYTAAGAPTFMAYKEGMVLWAKMPAGANNVAGARLAVDGLPFLPIVRPDGSAVVSADMLATRGVGFILINNQWQMFTVASDFMTLARQRLPIYPQVQTATGRFGVVSPGTGSIVIPNGVAFLHRGIFLDNTDNYSAPAKTFATLANKTYHLRWSPLGGFVLKDLADVAYNPTAAAEADVRFDSKYDDMLLARAVTSAGNIVTVTDLANLIDLAAEFQNTGAPTGHGSAASYSYSASNNINWGRTPLNVAYDGQITGNGPSLEGHEGWISTRSKTRYAVGGTTNADWRESEGFPTGVQGYLNISARA